MWMPITTMVSMTLMSVVSVSDADVGLDVGAVVFGLLMVMSRCLLQDSPCILNPKP